MGKSSLSITVASALPSSSPSAPPPPPSRPPSVQTWTSWTSPPSPATSVRSNIKPRSRQPHIQGPSLQRRLSGAFSTRNLEVLPSLVTPQSAHPVPGGMGPLAVPPAHTSVCWSRPPSSLLTRESPFPPSPLPPPSPPPPPIHPSTELHTCCSALRPLALHGLASHMPHTYTQSGPPSSACMSFSS